MVYFVGRFLGFFLGDALFVYLVCVDRFGMIGEAPHVQIGPDAAFIFMRHFVHREKAAAVEV